MISWIDAALLLALSAGLLPWVRAWFGLKGTSLRHAVVWSMLAWLGWIVAFIWPEVPAVYVALCLTSCAAIAVLGARRPHVGAWNFVVLGLLAVTILPLAEGMILGSAWLGPVRVGFLSVILMVGIGNFLPTSLGPAALLIGIACGTHLSLLLDPAATTDLTLLTGQVSLVLAPWVGLAGWKWRPRHANELDRRWLNFRDRFGLMWGLRVREQFNHAAGHAGWNVNLRWNGIVAKSPVEIDWAILATDFRALIQRFES